MHNNRIIAAIKETVEENIAKEIVKSDARIKCSKLNMFFVVKQNRAMREVALVCTNYNNFRIN